MWSKRVATVATMITIIAVGTAAPAANAGQPGEQFIGEFNGDELPDRVTLGGTAPNLCSTIVEYGSAPGVFRPPVVFTYLRPNGDTDLCPDIGVATDVNLDGLDELVIGWSNGAPTTLSYNRIVLTPPNFRPAAVYTSVIAQPTFLGVGTFQVGVPPMPYSVGPGGIINYVIEGGTVVPGAIRFCSVDAPYVQLADWAQDDIDGALIAYTNSCADGSSGVVRIRQNGSVVQLEHDPTGRTSWTARVVNADGDRFPDVRTINQTTGEVSYFINTGGRGMFFLRRAPSAQTDTIFLTKTKPLAIDVLDNDYASRHVTVTIASPPRYGTVQVLSDRRIVYRPSPNHGASDRFTYQLEEEGKRSKATVYLRYPQ